MSRFYLGIDVGASFTKAVLLKGLKKQNPECFAIKTPGNKNAFLGTMKGLVETLARGRNLAGLGVGLPGIVDPRRGVLRYAPNLRFLNGWNAKKFFQKFGARVAVDNDVRCLMLAEAIWGEAKGRKNAIVLAVGTGIGGGIMVDGKIYRGADNSAGEFGHMVMQDKKEFEYWAGGRFPGDRKNQEEVLGTGIANLVNILNPEVVIIGGGAARDGNLNLAVIRKTSKKFILPPLRQTPIVRTKLGNAAQAIGAVLLFAGRT